MIKVSAPVRIDISAGWSDAAPFVNDFGGAVLNAAINLRVEGILEGKNLTTSLVKIPPNSGLGTSGALRTVYLVVANPILIRDKIDLVKRVHTFENAIVDQRAGFQDQCAAVFGGVNYWRFNKNGSISRTEISRKATQHLLDRLVLVYTGVGHLSANVHESVFGCGNYIKHIPEINQMKKIAKKMCEKIDSEDAMADLINETWVLQKTLHNKIESESMKKIQEYARGYYLACRATGAGGGGCMIFYTNQKDKLIKVLKSAEKKIKGMEVLPFKFDYKGIDLANK